MKLTIILFGLAFSFVLVLNYIRFKSELREIDKNYKQECKLISFSYDYGYLKSILTNLENALLQYCIDAGITPMSSIVVPDDTDWGGRILYYDYKGYIENPRIQINEKYYNELIASSKKYPIAYGLKVQTLSHEIGHYIELLNGETTEKGADLEGARLAKSFLTDTEFYILGHANCFFTKMSDQDREVAFDDLNSRFNDPIKRAELIQAYENYYKVAI
jgi:hypothetical protein